MTFNLFRTAWVCLAFAGGPVNTPFMYIFRVVDKHIFNGGFGVVNGTVEEQLGEALLAVATSMEIGWMVWQLSVVFDGIRKTCYVVQDVSASFREEMLLGMMTSDRAAFERERPHARFGIGVSRAQRYLSSVISLSLSLSLLSRSLAQLLFLSNSSLAGEAPSSLLHGPHLVQRRRGDQRGDEKT